jgi:5-(carboxyamino)imidazole ribonucleotide synthase
MVRSPVGKVTPAPAAPSPLPARVILPGAVLGVMGGGQLGAMFAMAAKRMGYRVEAISESEDCPAAHHADRVHVGASDDTRQLEQIARSLDVLTFEFENVPVDAARAMQEVVPVRPDPLVLFTTQDRAREKAFLVEHGFGCAPHRVVRSQDELHAAVAALGLPAVLKTAAFGYDGKGQRKIEHSSAVDAAWEALGPEACVLEGWVDFDCEISVVAARGLDGATAVFEPSRNAHRHHILDVSSAPAGLPQAVCDTARDMASRILANLGVVGVACVEFFVTRDGRVLVNEIAPRPHNSGHLTIAACETSQFEQQVRAVCGLPLGSTQQLAPAAMANLLGDCWANGEPDWAAALAVPGVSLMLYGKSDPRPGRKMGHLTALAPTVEEAIANATKARGLACRDVDR